MDTAAMGINWLSIDPSKPPCPSCRGSVDLGSFYGFKKEVRCPSCGARCVVRSRQPLLAPGLPIGLGLLPSFTDLSLGAKVLAFVVGFGISFYLFGQFNASVQLAPMSAAEDAPAED